MGTETELFEERAAIIEYCGNMARSEAERLAREQQGIGNKFQLNEINDLWRK